MDEPIVDPVNEDPTPDPEPTPDPPAPTTLSNSILNTIKKMLGPTEDYQYFDMDIIVHINSAFERLCELGVGSSTPFFIEDDQATWSDFSLDASVTWQVMRYIYLYVKKIFDPTANSVIQQAYEAELNKLEWLMCSVSEVGY